MSDALRSVQPRLPRFHDVFLMSEKIYIYKGLLIILFTLASPYSASRTHAQTLRGPRPDVARALTQRVIPQSAQSPSPRKNGYTPERALSGNRPTAVPG